jgi:hypothetical protein
MPNVFSTPEIEQFIEDGYLVLREAFPPEVAASVRARLWTELELDPEQPSGWTRPMIHIKKSFTDPPFALAWTDRTRAAFDDLLGAERYRMPTSLGWFPITFPGFESPPWKPPVEGWHVDGIQFHHHVFSRDQGLLPIVILSDLGPGDGGTAIDLGSHKITARILADAEPDGLDVYELCRRVATHPVARALEVTGQAGDIALLHPFMRHTQSPNTGRSVRFICNPCISLHGHMDLKRTNPRDYSPVELAIVRALAN